MKKIEAVLPSSEQEPVTTALRQLGIDQIIASEVMSTGPTETRCYRGTTYAVDYFPRLKLEILTGDHNVRDAAEVIVKAIHRAGMSGLSVAVSAVEEVIQIEGDWRMPSGVPSPAAVPARAPWGLFGAHANHTS